MNYFFLVLCAAPASPSPSSHSSGTLKLLYYSLRVCQIPRQRQTHHPSPALCLRGNKVWGLSWVTDLCDRPSSRLGVASRWTQGRKKVREGERVKGLLISLSFKVKIGFLWQGGSHVTGLLRVVGWDSGEKCRWSCVHRFCSLALENRHSNYIFSQYCGCKLVLESSSWLIRPRRKKNILADQLVNSPSILCLCFFVIYSASACPKTK